MYKLFPVTHITRQDLVANGVVSEEEAKDISDDKMERIASKMGDAYNSCGYRTDLKIVADHELEN